MRGDWPTASSVELSTPTERFFVEEDAEEGIWRKMWARMGVGREREAGMWKQAHARLSSLWAGPSLCHGRQGVPVAGKAFLPPLTLWAEQAVCPHVLSVFRFVNFFWPFFDPPVLPREGHWKSPPRALAEPQAVAGPGIG